MTDDRIKNKAAINQLVSEFLKLQIVEISEKPDSNKQRERYFRLIDIAERVGSGNYDYVEIVNLFITLENKANEMVNQLIALSHATDLEGLDKSGSLGYVDNRLIDAADNAHKHYIRKRDSNRSSNAGKAKSDKELENAINKLEPLFEKFHSPETKILDGRGNEIPRSKWGAETFFNFCTEKSGTGFGKKMIKKAYKVLQGKASAM
ncbi:hypothetical protein [Thiothrix unzii]|uniref:Uncharacterized protein n=1 Tax=Thiothrix unzii TaxID=111769 RepID=A0A975IH57_9GAMM|nr:hypothetical protein [Thiothrix unzii]QTR52295.1 hypothetical protein J9260_11155 [Thiothrix unzii]